MGKSIPAGGTLVIGREQDCVGGCFDSASGAVGRTQTLDDQEYGAQDFFGVVEEMRVWKVGLPRPWPPLLRGGPAGLAGRQAGC
jgi:hypothetical protein